MLLHSKRHVDDCHNKGAHHQENHIALANEHVSTFDVVLNCNHTILRGFKLVATRTPFINVIFNLVDYIISRIVEQEILHFSRRNWLKVNFTSYFSFSTSQEVVVLLNLDQPINVGSDCHSHGS
jgi:hypothetical protein